MLKLALKPGDSITIGDEICIKLSEETNCNAQLLIDAPKEYRIKRHKKEKRIYIVSNR